MPDWPHLPSWIAQIDVLALVHLAIGLSLLELAGRLVHAWRRGQPGLAWGAAFHLGAGLCLMGALREALTDNRPLGLLLWLSAAGIAHLADTLWRRPSRRGP